MVLPAYIDESTGAITDGEAWVALETRTLGSDTASITFTSTDDGQVGDWSQYMDLFVIAYARSTKSGTDDTTYFQLNSDTGSNYAYQYLNGGGALVTAGYGTTSTARQGTITGNTATANIFGAVISHLFDINSGKYKSIVSQGAGDRDGAGEVDMWGHTWKSQDPITTILMSCTSGDILSGSRIDLFGILPRMVA